MEFAYRIKQTRHSIMYFVFKGKENTVCLTNGGGTALTCFFTGVATFNPFSFLRELMLTILVLPEHDWD